MIDYELPYHILEEDDEGNYLPRLSFRSYEEAFEFTKFVPGNLIIVSKSELDDFLEINQ